MRFFLTVATAAALSVAQGAIGEERRSVERTKTGILPNGGFYTMYAVNCGDERVVEVASTDRRQRWCARSGAELACYRSVDAATDKACANAQVAANDTAGNEFTN